MKSTAQPWVECYYYQKSTNLSEGVMWVVTRWGGADGSGVEQLWCARWRCLDEKHCTVIDELMLLTIYHSDLCVCVCVGCLW